MTLRTALACTLAACVFAACTTKQSAPVVERSGGIPTAPAATPAAAPAAGAQSADFYTVKRGETLYGIALDNGQDYRDIAAWNNLANPNVIQAGQVLRVRPPGAPAASGLPDSGVVVRPITPPGGVMPGAPGAPVAGGLKTEPNGAKRPYSEEALAQAQRETRTTVASAPAAAPAVAPAVAAVPVPAPAAKPADSEDIAWAWPAAGKVIGNFTEGGANKGVDIAAKVGEPVLAAAPGKVVYSGQGLRGYGRLIIIKHNNDFLSAYAHNSNLMVKEGQPVTRGQKIAEAGNTDSDVPKLHFEIRRQGKPVDPTKYLPNR